MLQKAIRHQDCTHLGYPPPLFILPVCLGKIIPLGTIYIYVYEQFTTSQNSKAKQPSTYYLLDLTLPKLIKGIRPQGNYFFPNTLGE